MTEGGSSRIVTAAVIEQNGSFLVTKRPSGKPLAGFWEFPGGKCDPDEAPPACLVREILEELGAGVRVGPEILRTTDADREQGIELRFFRCELIGEPRPLLGQEIRWVPRARLLDLRFPPADAALVRMLAGGGTGD